jgi:hypothetical protein
MWWVVFELEAPAFAGLILGLTFKNKKRQWNKKIGNFG